MTENKLLAEVNGKEIYSSDVYDLMAGMADSSNFNTNDGFKVLADEVVNQELLLQDAFDHKYDEDEEFLRELNSVKNNMLKNYAMHKIFDSIVVSDDEVKSYYEENKNTIFSPITYTASHILIDSEDEAYRIIDEINNGLSFEKAAQNYSKDPSAQNGGRLGTFPKGIMVKEFQDGLDTIDAGEISKPIKSQFGYHIIKLEDKTSNETSYDEIKDQVRSTYEMYKRQESYLNKVNELSKNAEVKKYY